ncbi:putative pyridoxal-dependent decarboxylase domain-containing protein 2 isoform X2 [Lineus longissimus]|uniref:putative pyridoxal-dependent decarboxylase domain-containing protein 2 isoform X2 n=1 Tax=Lineus longissimus TaxID=88925 RepID=UPI002B4EABCA
MADSDSKPVSSLEKINENSPLKTPGAMSTPETVNQDKGPLNGHSPKEPESPVPMKTATKPTMSAEEEMDVTVKRHARLGQAFMSPMLADLEEKIRKNNEILDNISAKWDEEREEKRKKERSTHIPGPLQGTGQQLDTVMKRLEDLILYENFNDEEEDETKLVRASLKKLDSHGEVAILAHSLGAFISTLGEEHLKRISARIISDTTLWISRLFRFKDSAAYFHEEKRDGLVRVCRLALQKKYPKYGTEGFEALYSKPPVLYVSTAAEQGLGQYICTQLGLPVSCLSTVPCNTVFGSQHKMDIAALEKLVQDDISSGKTPLLMIAYAGTPLVGEVDNLPRLQEICKKDNIWLHLEGHHLATLSWFSVPTAVQPATSGDSMTVSLGQWLGLPGVPYTTIYKSAEPPIAHAAGLTSFSTHYRLSCLPLWIVLQTVGHENVVNRIKHCIDMSVELGEVLKPIPSIKLEHIREEIENDPGPRSIRELITKAIDAILVFEIANPTVVFRYQVEAAVSNIAGFSAAGEAKSDSTAEYFDALNIWLAETLQRDVPEIGIDTIELDGQGTCIRFCSLETVQSLGTESEHIKRLAACMKEKMEILNATVKERENFQAIVEAQDNIHLIDLSDWAGLGAVQYIPDMWLDKMSNLPPAARRDINDINLELVNKLKSNDNAFALGKTDDDVAYSRFGLITPATDVEELVALVYATGKEIEESSRYLEKMADMIKKGIDEANKDLEKENDNKLLQEGVLRQVPIVSSLVNWWSPPPKDVAKGRMFNLSSGKVISTEDTYKYHMQVQENNTPKSPTSKTGPLKTVLKPKKSPLSGSMTNGPSHQHNDSISSTTSSLDSTKTPVDGGLPQLNTSGQLELAEEAMPNEQIEDAK